MEVRSVSRSSALSELPPPPPTPNPKSHLLPCAPLIRCSLLLTLDFGLFNLFEDQVSTIPLQFVGASFLPPAAKLIVQVTFSLLFFIIRIILVPIIWMRWISAFYQLEQRGNVTCFPHYFIYLVWIFGVLFHGLNLYCECDGYAILPSQFRIAGTQTVLFLAF